MKKQTIEKISLINHATVKSINDYDKIAIVKRFTETGIKLLGADSGFAWWKLSKSDPYKLAYKSRNILHEPNPSGHQKGYKALKQGMPVFVSDALTTRSGQKQDVGEHVKSYVVIPVAFQKQSYGNIIICFNKHKNFSSGEKSLCDMLGKAMAQAITINKLHSDLKNFKSTLDKTLDSI
jgi:GAF domain-containing protein